LNRHWLSGFNTRLYSIKATIHIHVVMHVLTFTHKSFSVKTHPPRGGVKGGKMGEGGKGQGVIYRAYFFL